MRTQAEQKRFEEEQEEARLEAIRKKQDVPLSDTFEPVAAAERISTEKTIQGNDDVLHSMLTAYKEDYSNEPWYKEPETDNQGHLCLTFKNEDTAMKFFEKQAENGHKFIVIGSTGQVTGNSDGTGVFNRNTDNKTLKEIEAELAGHDNRVGYGSSM